MQVPKQTDQLRQRQTQKERHRCDRLPRQENGDPQDSLGGVLTQSKFSKKRCTDNVIAVKSRAGRPNTKSG